MHYVKDKRKIGLDIMEMEDQEKTEDVKFTMNDVAK